MTAVASIDCGTNAIRLLVLEQVDDVVVEVTREMTIVRLGEGVDRTGEFSRAALERTWAAVEDYARTMATHGVTAARFVATSASRDATNRWAFVDGVRERMQSIAVLDVEPEVIPGEEEAALSFRGATDGLPGLQRPALVVDIGGGSTEFVLGSDGPDAVRSVDIGCVRMTERHLHDDPPTPAQIEATIADIDAAIDRAAEIVPLDRARSLVGVAGTVTTIAAIAHGLPEYDAARIHGLVVEPAEVVAISERLLGMTHAERAAIPVMHPGRVDVIGGGGLVLSRIVARTGLPVVASEHDLLDAIAYSLLP